MKIEAVDWAPYARITQARAYSQELLGRFRESIQPVTDGTSDVVVSVTGSLGRLEATPSSDIDYNVCLLDEGVDPDLVTSIETACEAFVAETELREPNPTGHFGVAFQLHRIIEQTGNHRAEADGGDTNGALTRRMLLMNESAWISNSNLHDYSVARIRSNYLRHHKRIDRPPRFLLNDTVRFWRTMCVDFQGKMVARDNDGWGTRNAKLRMSRKLLFVGAVLPLFCVAAQRTGVDEVDEALAAWTAEVPLDRLVRACDQLDADQVLDALLRAYDDFLEMLANQRDELDDIGPGERAENDTWLDLKEIEGRFQSGLTTLFFETEIRDLVQTYAIF